MVYTISIGITLFGNSIESEWIYSDIVNEFKEFIEANSQFKLNIVSNQYPSLQSSDIGYWDTQNPPCYFVSPQSLTQASIDKLPFNVGSNIVLYDYINLSPVCWGGGTYPKEYGIDGVPFIAIPLNFGNNTPFYPWKRSGSQILVHEWLHALDDIFLGLGYPGFISSDECDTMGYTSINGWQDCYKRLLSEITIPMYQAISGSTGTVSGCTNCDYTHNYCIANRCISKRQVLLYVSVGVGAILLF